MVCALVAALYLICAYAAQSGSVPLHLRYALTGVLFAFWPILFISLSVYAIYSAWKTRQRDSILLVITSLLLTFWMAPIMLKMSYFSLQAAFRSSSAKATADGEKPVENHAAPTHEKKAEHKHHAQTHHEHHAHIKEVTTEKELKHLISESNKHPLVVKIFATWCGPCQQMVPNYKAVAAELHHKITFAEINFDMFDNKDALGVRGLPTIICYKNGSEAFRIGGYRTKEQLNEEISKLL